MVTGKGRERDKDQLPKESVCLTKNFGFSPKTMRNQPKSLESHVKTLATDGGGDREGSTKITGRSLVCVLPHFTARHGQKEADAALPTAMPT